METKKRIRLNRPLLFVMLLLIGLVLATTIYFYLWRPSDSDLQGALESTSSLQNDVTISLPSLFQYINSPNTITPDVVTSLKQSAESYAKSLATLEKSPAVQRISSINSLYNTHKSDLKKYGQDLVTLSVSVSAYNDIRDACDELAARITSIRSEAEYTTVSADCKKTIAAAEANSPNDDFNKQFFDRYRKVSSYLVTAVGKYFAASAGGDANQIVGAKAAVALANTEMKKATDVTIQHSLESPSSDFFTQMRQTLDGLRSSFIR